MVNLLYHHWLEDLKSLNLMMMDQLRLHVIDKVQLFDSFLWEYMEYQILIHQQFVFWLAVKKRRNIKYCFVSLNIK